MLINSDDAAKRLNNPLNLINRMRTATGTNDKRKNAMSLFVRPSVSKPEMAEIKPCESVPMVPFVNPFKKSFTDTVIQADDDSVKADNYSIAKQDDDSIKTGELVEDVDTKIKLAYAHDNALKLLSDSIDMMKLKLDDIKPGQLPSVISATSKVVESIRRERLEHAKSNKEPDVHFHFYTPEQRKIETYEVIEVNG